MSNTKAMDGNFKEQDPYKTNLFKVGDLVRVHFSEKDIPDDEFPVKKFLEGLVEKVSDDFIVVGGEVYLFHQARLLLKETVNTIWIKFYKQQVGYSTFQVLSEDPKDPTWDKYQLVTE